MRGTMTSGAIFVDVAAGVTAPALAVANVHKGWWGVPCCPSPMAGALPCCTLSNGEDRGRALFNKTRGEPQGEEPLPVALGHLATLCRFSSSNFHFIFPFCLASAAEGLRLVVGQGFFCSFSLPFPVFAPPHWVFWVVRLEAGCPQRKGKIFEGRGEGGLAFAPACGPSHASTDHLEWMTVALRTNLFVPPCPPAQVGLLESRSKRERAREEQGDPCPPVVF